MINERDIKFFILTVIKHIRPDGDFYPFDYDEREELLNIAKRMETEK